MIPNYINSVNKIFDDDLTANFKNITDDLINQFLKYDKSKYNHQIVNCKVNKFYDTPITFELDKTCDTVYNTDYVFNRHRDFHYFITTENGENTDRFHEKWRITFTGFNNPLLNKFMDNKIIFDCVIYQHEKITTTSESFSYVFKFLKEECGIRKFIIFKFYKLYINGKINYVCVPIIKMLIPKLYTDFLNHYMEFEFYVIKSNNKFNIYLDNNKFYDDEVKFYNQNYQNNKEENNKLFTLSKESEDNIFKSLIKEHKFILSINKNDYIKTDEDMIISFEKTIDDILRTFNDIIDNFYNGCVLSNNEPEENNKQNE